MHPPLNHENHSMRKVLTCYRSKNQNHKGVDNSEFFWLSFERNDWNGSFYWIDFGCSQTPRRQRHTTYVGFSQQGTRSSFQNMISAISVCNKLSELPKVSEEESRHVFSMSSARCLCCENELTRVVSMKKTTMSCPQSECVWKLGFVLSFPLLTMSCWVSSLTQCWWVCQCLLPYH